uniref:Ashwin n=1 Tax=Anser brachyrhynchus TaxID=132585 RepID=A0A8B9CKX4_9AVES
PAPHRSDPPLPSPVPPPRLRALTSVPPPGPAPSPGGPSAAGSRAGGTRWRRSGGAGRAVSWRSGRWGARTRSCCCTRSCSRRSSCCSPSSSVIAVEGLRKRPLIVFDGSSTSTSIKVKKTENGATDRLKPPPAGSTTNTVRRLSASSNASSYISASSLSEDAKLEVRNSEAKQNNISKTNSSVLASLKAYPLTPVAGTTVVKLKRSVPKEDSELPNDLKPTEAKKKIQHVTWP